jgi:exodeoxyribonuclease VII small subunit
MKTQKGKDDASTGEQPGFEESLRAVEQAVAALESGKLDLDAALKAYESGIQQLQRCQALLDAAEHKVRLLTGVDADGNPCVEPFEVEPGDGQ